MYTYMDIYKIVKGNSFDLFIKLQKAYISKNKQMLEDIDVAAISNLEVHLTDAFGECVAKMPFVQSGTNNSEVEPSDICVKFPPFLEEGLYGITIRGKYNGNDICSIEHHLFRIVERNGKSHIPLGIVEGEMGGMYNAKYWIELNNQNDADVDDTNVYLEASPSVIAYDGTEHTIKLSWQIRKNGIDTIPDNIKIIDGSNVIEPKTTDTSVNVSRSQVGSYAFHIIVTLNGKIYKATAFVTIGAKTMYGASSLSDANELDLSVLNGSNTSLVNQTITVTTTDENDVVWFISDTPLQFIQGNIEADFHETIIGSLYYYNSDPLIAGDNTYTIKAK